MQQAHLPGGESSRRRLTHRAIRETNPYAATSCREQDATSLRHLDVLEASRSETLDRY